MRRWLGLAAVAVGLLAMLKPHAPACTLCAGGSPQQVSTFRQDVDQAKMVLYGVLKDAKAQGKHEVLMRVRMSGGTRFVALPLGNA